MESKRGSVARPAYLQETPLRDLVAYFAMRKFLHSPTICRRSLRSLQRYRCRVTECWVFTALTQRSRCDESSDMEFPQAFPVCFEHSKKNRSGGRIARSPATCGNPATLRKDSLRFLSRLLQRECITLRVHHLFHRFGIAVDR